MEKPAGEVDNHLPADWSTQLVPHRSDPEHSSRIAYSDHVRRRSLTLPATPAFSSPQASLALQQSRSRAIRSSITPLRQPQGPASGKKSMRSSLHHSSVAVSESQENVGPANYSTIDKLLQSDKTLQQIANSIDPQTSATSIPARLILPPPGFLKTGPVVVTKDAVFGVEQLTSSVSKLEIDPGLEAEAKTLDPAKSRVKASDDRKPPAINTSHKGISSSAANSPTLASPLSTSSLQYHSFDNSQQSSPLAGPAHIKHTLYKTELCRSYEETGYCRYSNKCQFAHGEAELRLVQRHPKYKTEICRTYWERGDCPYGKRCCFVHNEVDRLKGKELAQAGTLMGLKGSADFATGTTGTAASSPDSSRVGTPALATGGPSTPTTIGFGGTISLGSSGVDLTKKHPQPLRESRLPEPSWLNGNDWYYRTRQPMYEFELPAQMNSSPGLGAQNTDFTRETEFFGRDLFSTFNLSKDNNFDDYSWVRPRAQSDASLVDFGGWNSDFHNIGRFKQISPKHNAGAKGEKPRLPVFRHLC